MTTATRTKSASSAQDRVRWRRRDSSDRRSEREGTESAAARQRRRTRWRRRASAPSCRWSRRRGQSGDDGGACIDGIDRGLDHHAAAAFELAAEREARYLTMAMMQRRRATIPRTTTIKMKRRMKKKMKRRTCNCNAQRQRRPGQTVRSIRVRVARTPDAALRLPHPHPHQRSLHCRNEQHSCRRSRPL